MHDETGIIIMEKTPATMAQQAISLEIPIVFPNIVEIHLNSQGNSAGIGLRICLKRFLIVKLLELTQSELLLDVSFHSILIRRQGVYITNLSNLVM
jgi:hypothetical protein